MNLPVIAISKIDGGYLISCGDEVAVMVTWDDASFLIKKWLDDPPTSDDQAEIDKLIAQIKTANIHPPAWVDEVIKKN
jgi:hypothetical protein